MYYETRNRPKQLVFLCVACLVARGGLEVHSEVHLESFVNTWGPTGSEGEDYTNII